MGLVCRILLLKTAFLQYLWLVLIFCVELYFAEARSMCSYSGLELSVLMSGFDHIKSATYT